MKVVGWMLFWGSHPVQPESPTSAPDDFGL